MIDWDGRKVKMYHYVATADFPYTVGCLRGDYDRAAGARHRRPAARRTGLADAPARSAGRGPPPSGPPPR